LYESEHSAEKLAKSLHESAQEKATGSGTAQQKPPKHAVALKSKEVAQRVAPKGKEVAHAVAPKGMELAQAIAPKGMQLAHAVAPKGMELAHAVAPKRIELARAVAPKRMELAHAVAHVIAPKGMELARAVSPKGMELMHAVAQKVMLMHAITPKGKELVKEAERAVADVKKQPPTPLGRVSRMKSMHTDRELISITTTPDQEFAAFVARELRSQHIAQVESLSAVSTIMDRLAALDAELQKQIKSSYYSLESHTATVARLNKALEKEGNLTRRLKRQLKAEASIRLATQAALRGQTMLLGDRKCQAPGENAQGILTQILPGLRAILTFLALCPILWAIANGPAWMHESPPAGMASVPSPEPVPVPEVSCDASVPALYVYPQSPSTQSKGLSEADADTQGEVSPSPSSKSPRSSEVDSQEANPSSQSPTSSEMDTEEELSPSSKSPSSSDLDIQEEQITKKNVLECGFPFVLYQGDSDTEADLRFVKIQCVSVCGGDIDVEMVDSETAVVTINRKATQAIEADTWVNRFDLGDGPFEFRKDLMELKQGLLTLAFCKCTTSPSIYRFPQHFSLASTSDDDGWALAGSSDGTDSALDDDDFELIERVDGMQAIG
jgi:hypothetical protein